MKKITGYINNYEEAMLIMHASRLGCFELTRERLSSDERDKIESGDIFCFIENENGLKRWTDGRIWSPSKICGEFLVYQEVPRHLSKNSIKKRKTDETKDQIRLGLSKKEETVDRTTMHKKTICIKFENCNYHIIAYYRPIFVNNSLMDIPFFQKLSNALNIYPVLKDDDFVRQNLDRETGFFERFRIQREYEYVVLEKNKRAMLEGIAVDVLASLSKESMRRRRQFEL